MGTNISRARTAISLSFVSGAVAVLSSRLRMSSVMPVASVPAAFTTFFRRSSSNARMLLAAVSMSAVDLPGNASASLRRAVISSVFSTLAAASAWASSRLNCNCGISQSLPRLRRMSDTALVAATSVSLPPVAAGFRGCPQGAQVARASTLEYAVRARSSSSRYCR
jgi:hypothetical protein